MRYNRGMRIVLRPIHAVIALSVLGALSFMALRLADPAPAQAIGAPPALDPQVAARTSALVAVLLAGMDAPKTHEPPSGWTRELGLRLGQNARDGLTHPPWGFRDDCSGFISWVLTESGVPADGRVASLFDLAVANEALHWKPLPFVGDLVFFDHTHDRDDDEDWNDELTHIGVVIDVEPDGTARFAHGGTSSGRKTGAINLLHPDDHADTTGKIVNSYVREPRGDDPADATYLAGELFAAFATVDPTRDWLGAAP